MLTFRKEQPACSSSSRHPTTVTALGTIGEVDDSLYHSDSQVSRDFLRDVARGAVVLASDDAAFVTGIAIPTEGGYTCW